MRAFFIIAGICVTIVGLVSFAIISGVYFAVRFFGYELTLGNKNKKNDDPEH